MQMRIIRKYIQINLEISQRPFVWPGHAKKGGDSERNQAALQNEVPRIIVYLWNHYVIT